jgi:hypothetical protein
MGWNKEKVHLGNVNENTQHKYVFEYDGPKKIKEVSTNCGCTVGEKTDKTVSVTWKIGKVLQRIKLTFQNIKVTFDDDTSTTLRIEAMVRKPINHGNNK